MSTTLMYATAADGILLNGPAPFYRIAEAMSATAQELQVTHPDIEYVRTAVEICTICGIGRDNPAEFGMELMIVSKASNIRIVVRSLLTQFCDHISTHEHHTFLHLIATPINRTTDANAIPLVDQIAQMMSSKLNDG